MAKKNLKQFDGWENLVTYFASDREIGEFRRLDLPSDAEEMEWVLKANRVPHDPGTPFSTMNGSSAHSFIHGHKVFAVMFPDGRVWDAALDEFRPEHPHQTKGMYEILLKRNS